MPIQVISVIKVLLSVLMQWQMGPIPMVKPPLNSALASFGTLAVSGSAFRQNKD